jgi:hypothetical protein
MRKLKNGDVEIYYSDFIKLFIKNIFKKSSIFSIIHLMKYEQISMPTPEDICNSDLVKKV